MNTDLWTEISRILFDFSETIFVPSGDDSSPTDVLYLVMILILILGTAVILYGTISFIVRLVQLRNQKNKFEFFINSIKDDFKKSLEKINENLQKQLEDYKDAAEVTEELPGLKLDFTNFSQKEDIALDYIGNINEDAFQVLISECRKLGEQIDSHTNRKSNSNKISQLVFRIALKMGYSEKIATVFFCAAMIYDAGCLESPSEYFRREILTADEKKDLNFHVLRGLEYINFIPDQIYVYFFEACTFHHENIDGSGFPENLREKEIPYIARLIHVVETYLALTRKRVYRIPVSKKRAIVILKRNSESFDQEIVDVLATLT